MQREKRPTFALAVRLLRRLGHAGDGRATGVMRFWLLWEAIWLPHLRTLRPGGIVRYTLGRHRGRHVRLNDGVVVERGDRLVELHMDNRTLHRLAGEQGGFDTFAAERSGTAELHELAARIERGDFGVIVALHAVTPFTPALRRQGFEVHPVSHTVGSLLTRYYMLGLLALYHPRGWDAVTPARARRWPSEVWMSRTRFLARMGSLELPSA